MAPRSLEPGLAALERQDLRRARRIAAIPPEAGNPVLMQVDGRRLVNFCGNDYLGLSQHPRLIEALSASAAACGVGSGASHLVTGHGFEHERLEEELAAFTGRERALLFSTGYMANLGVVTAFAGRGDLVLLDRLNHASLIDGALLSGARLQRYAHGDAEAAGRLLRARLATRDAGVLVATDGVFSMDGDIAPLPALAAVAKAHDAWLLVDDAHGLGVVGTSGRGSLELHGLDAAEVPLLVGTLGKAFGTFGAFVAGRADVIEHLVQHARPYIYTTALPPAVAAATRAALDLVQREGWRRERLASLVARFRAGASALEVPLTPSATAIQPVPIGGARDAVAASRALEERGFRVAAIRPPTVPNGSARLRVTLSAAHAEAQVDALVESLAHVMRSVRTGAA